VPRPQFPETRTDFVADIRRDVKRLASQLTEVCLAKDLGDFLIGIDETPIPHGLPAAPKRWTATNLDAFAHVRETRRPDARYVFLVADAQVTAGVVVW
jgi:hypothetical protein